jgi:hypothetical protein
MNLVTYLEHKLGAARGTRDEKWSENELGGVSGFVNLIFVPRIEKKMPRYICRQRYVVMHGEFLVVA